MDLFMLCWRFAAVLGLAPLMLYSVLEEGAREQNLPLGSGLHLCSHVEIRFHGHSDWSQAFYLPALPDVVSAEQKTADKAREAVRGPMRPGQLWLHAPTYLSGPGMRALVDMPVDVSEHLFNAILTGHLDPARIRGTKLLETLDARGGELFEGVPQEQRTGAYLDALASFGSHILSMANELERKQQARLEEGRSLCALIDREATLFGLWKRSFAVGTYPGRYQLAPDRGLSSTVYSRAVLEAEDKELVVRDVLGSSWTGSPQADFGHRFCVETTQSTGTHIP